MAVPTKPLTKTQLIATLSKQTGSSKKEITSFLEALTQLAYQETKKKGKFTFPGLGSLKLVKRAARMGRNPLTGEAIKIPAKTVVKFTVQKTAKDAITGAKPKQ